MLRKDLDLTTDCVLQEKYQKSFMGILEKHINAFSTHGEIGDTKHVVDLPIKDHSSKNIRAYNIPFSYRPFIDKEMERLKNLGVISEGMATFTSPVFLVAKKCPDAPPRIVQDLRVLNSKISPLNYAYPLSEECMQSIGDNKSNHLSILDITDAFFGIHLSEHSQNYCGISAYPNSKPYKFKRLPMGLANSPAFFMSFLSNTLNKIPNYQEFISFYVDDVIVHSKSCEEHLKHIAQLLELFDNHGIKIKPRKAHFFRHTVDFLGFKIIIEDNVAKITPQQTKIDAILKLKIPKTIKAVRGLCGMVQFLAKFCPKLSDILAPIRELTKKGAVLK
jgi:hypothetical protein